MGTTADIMTAGGIQQAAAVVELATITGLDLAVACTLLEKESGGGRNVWGSDGVATGGAYTKGGPVTRANYEAYRRALAAGQAGAQGVGPTQLTYRPYQDRADQLGGCWDPRANMRAGFEILAGLIGKYGEERGFAAYNGGDRAGQRAGVIPDADQYGRDAMVRLARWRAQLGGAVAMPAAPPAAPGALGPRVPGELREGDTGAAVLLFQRWLNATFPAYSRIDLGPQRYGPQTVAAVAEFQRRSGIDGDGRNVGRQTLAAARKLGYRG